MAGIKHQIIFCQHIRKPGWGRTNILLNILCITNLCLILRGIKYPWTRSAVVSQTNRISGKINIWNRFHRACLINQQIQNSCRWTQLCSFTLTWTGRHLEFQVGTFGCHDQPALLHILNCSSRKTQGSTFSMFSQGTEEQSKASLAAACLLGQHYPTITVCWVSPGVQSLNLGQVLPPADFELSTAWIFSSKLND